MLGPPPQAVLDFKGGEAAALQRLRHYLWDSHAIASYFDTRNGMLGEPLGCGCRAPGGTPLGGVAAPPCGGPAFW